MTAANAQVVQNGADPLKSVATAMANAVRDGAGDAVLRAQQAVPAAGKFVSRAVYSGFYYLSYGVVFPTLLVTNFVPGFGPIGDGLVGGAHAALDVVAEMKEKSAARKAAKAESQPA